MKLFNFITFTLFISLLMGCTHTYIATNSFGKSVLPILQENTARIVIYRPFGKIISIFESPEINIDSEKKTSIPQGQYTYYDVQIGKHFINISGELISLELSAGETTYIKLVYIQTHYISYPGPFPGHYKKLTATQVHPSQGALEITNLKELRE